jgi:hypothetical protein
MTEDSPVLIFGRQLLGQIFWIREHETYDVHAGTR